MQNPFLIGTQVYLRPLERTDAPVLVKWINDPQVTRTLQHYRPQNLQTEEAWVDGLYRAEHDLVLGIAVKEDDRLVGCSGLHNIDYKDRKASIGIMIGEPEEWGKGYGSEATALMINHGFATLNLHRVWLHVYAHNARAIAAYEKLGFQREGTLRQDLYREGRYIDVYTMGMLREEWGGAQIVVSDQKDKKD
jgi:RimJ/RimL family protein N-acetyltransferase